MKAIFSAIIAVALLNVQVHSQDAADCAAVTCLEGFDCIDGVCVRRTPQPRKKLCTLNFDLSPIKCTNRNYECVDVADTPSCGFLSDGTKQPFVNDCEPCLDRSVSFYYRVPCEQAPIVCNHQEQCVNGQCLALFNDPQDEKRTRCDSNSDCRQIVERCVAGKCVRLTELVNTLQGSGIQAPRQ